MEKNNLGLQPCEQPLLKVALVGYGKMGKEIESIACKNNVEIKAKLDLRTMSPLEIEKAVSFVDICIDFTRPESVLNNIKILSHLKKNVVIGTTGFEKHLPEVKNLAQKNEIGILYSPNFSIGVLLFIEIIKKAATLFSPFSEYDVSGFEAHHKDKIDMPSGTAKHIGDTLLNAINRKTKVVYQKDTLQDPKAEISFSSLRSGAIPGTHTVLFDSFADTITLTHSARNRSGFASGALFAAHWLKGKKGFFTLDDILGSFNKSKK
ncbi:4-hydroxy-tetrahydrodipicolinate reductase [Criblamydia sequanensis]|uniref:4-hydroxy-tetrahydrodipicolinate reductase n=1 Tax=Candidatus Criblamydia sequanensis CRIB-18 TaxID=1437425 RepID=A0A090D0P7_9BACT|nr:4-hydroxy-tetrahydrodipicolinate reductase [Criblamydia sequanensis]CDR35117.1 Dihydrodipicolinate reductase [Criblamydia sequanensis CRIB-18]